MSIWFGTAGWEVLAVGVSVCSAALVDGGCVALSLETSEWSTIAGTASFAAVEVTASPFAEVSAWFAGEAIFAESSEKVLAGYIAT